MAMQEISWQYNIYKDFGGLTFSCIVIPYSEFHKSPTWLHTHGVL